MRKVIISLIVLVFPFYFPFAQSKEAFNSFTTPIGKDLTDLYNAGTNSGFALVNSDSEGNGKVFVQEYINKKNEKVQCQLKFNQSTKKCFAASFMFPMETLETIMTNLNKVGIRQGVYYNWKVPKLGYEVFISKDEDNGVYYYLMFPIKD